MKGRGEMKPKKESNSNELLERVRRIFFPVCVAVFCLSLTALMVLFLAEEKGNRKYEELDDLFLSEEMHNFLTVNTPEYADGTSDSIFSENKSEMLGEESTEQSVFFDKEYRDVFLQMREEFVRLREINPDIFGWIKIDQTNIDYPILQTDDNEYYLNLDYEREYYPSGSIFMDYRCDKNLTENFNSVIYGHNAEMSGTMFHDIEKFFDIEFFQNTYIYIYTTEGITVYEPFSLYITRADYRYIETDFKDKNEFLAFVEEMRGNTNVEYDGDISDVEGILTLSTCTNGFPNMRYALHAKRVKMITLFHDEITEQ